MAPRPLGVSGMWPVPLHMEPWRWFEEPTIEDEVVDEAEESSEGEQVATEPSFSARAPIKPAESSRLLPADFGGPRRCNIQACRGAAVGWPLLGFGGVGCPLLLAEFDWSVGVRDCSILRAPPALACWRLFDVCIWITLFWLPVAAAAATALEDDDVSDDRLGCCKI